MSYDNNHFEQANMVGAIGDPEHSTSEGQNELRSSMQSLLQQQQRLNAPSHADDNAWLLASSSGSQSSDLLASWFANAQSSSGFASGGSGGLHVQPQSNSSLLEHLQRPQVSQSALLSTLTNYGTTGTGSGTGSSSIGPMPGSSGFHSQNHMPNMNNMNMNMNSMMHTASSNNIGLPSFSTSLTTTAVNDDSNSNNNDDDDFATVQLRQKTLLLQIENSKLERYLHQQKRQLTIMQQQRQQQLQFGQTPQQIHLQHQPLNLPTIPSHPSSSPTSMMRTMMTSMKDQAWNAAPTSIPPVTDVNSMLDAAFLDLPQLQQQQQHQQQQRRNSMAGLLELFNSPLDHFAGASNTGGGGGGGGDSSSFGGASTLQLPHLLLLQQQQQAQAQLLLQQPQHPQLQQLQQSNYPNPGNVAAKATAAANFNVNAGSNSGMISERVVVGDCFSIAQNQPQHHFPMKLHRLLVELTKTPAGQEIASFSSDGKSFAIHNPSRFETEILPVYFPRMKHLASFQRQLNLYDFQRVSVRLGGGKHEQQDGGGSNKKSSNAKGSYYFHSRFVRDRPELCMGMRRIKTKSSSAA